MILLLSVPMEKIVANAVPISCGPFVGNNKMIVTAVARLVTFLSHTIPRHGGWHVKPSPAEAEATTET